MLRIGLTGGIGSGKSTVARLLQARGAAVIDADAISRSTTQRGGSAIPAIIQAFGAEFVDAGGALDRQRMREHVFAHPEARRALEAIIHPLVGAEVRRQTLACAAHCVVFDIPLLVESPHWRHQLDRVVVVDCLESTQLKRVSERSGWDATTTQTVIRSQSSRQRRLAAADAVLFNDSNNMEQLQSTVDQLARRLGL